MGDRVRAEPRHKPLPVEPATLLTEGKLTEAVEVLRRSHGLGRREARAWIKRHLADDPMLEAQIELQRRARRFKVIFWVCLIDILIAAGIIYYLFYLPR
jgi:hypothetical protein